MAREEGYEKKVVMTVMGAVVIMFGLYSWYDLWQVKKLGVLDSFEYLASHSDDVIELSAKTLEVIKAQSLYKKNQAEGRVKLEQFQKEGVSLATVLLYSNTASELYKKRISSFDTTTQEHQWLAPEKQKLLNIIDRGVLNASGDELIRIFKLMEDNSVALGITKGRLELISGMKHALESDPQFMTYHVNRIKAVKTKLPSSWVMEIL